MKKLGLSDGPELMQAINDVIETYGRSERNKYRAVIYYMLTKKFGKESVTAKPVALCVQTISDNVEETCQYSELEVSSRSMLIRCQTC